MKPLLFTALFLLTISSKIVAQPFSLDDRVKPIQLEFRDFNPKDSIKQGKISIASVEQTEDTMYFYASGISIYSPVFVGITGDKDCSELKVSLHRDNWHKASQSGNTDTKRHWETKFKTEGDFGIMVVAPTKPSKYAIIVWNGKDVKPTMPSVFKTKSKSSGGGLFSSKNLLIGGIVLLLIIVGFLIYKRQKGKNEK